MLEIEVKEDSAEKLAAVQGKPTKNYLFAQELNEIVAEVNALDASINPDRIISLGTETVDVNEYTYEGYTWQLDGVQINNIGNPSIIVIPSATIGYKRNDISVFKADGTIERIAGTETNGEVVTTPDVPEGTLFYKSYSVNGNDIDAEPEPPAIDGTIYKKKIENTRWKSLQSGSNVVIPFQAAGQSHYSVVHSGLVSVAGFSTALLTTPMYEGQDVLFENQTGNPITLKDSFAGVNTPFDLGADLVVPNEGKIWFRSRNGKLELIMKSWSYVDLSTKADLVGGKVPASQLPSYVDDVIEGYFNGTNFYTDSGFTNLITPESSKIYLNIAVTPATQYRWSGSAYVQIGGGVDEFFTIGQNSFLINSPGVGIWTQQQISSFTPFNLTRTTSQTNHLLIIPDTLTWQGFVPFDCFLSNVFARYDGGGGSDEGIVVYKTTGFTTSPTVIYLKNSHTGATVLNETFTSGTTINKGDFIHIFVKRNVNVTNISTRMLLTFKRL